MTVRKTPAAKKRDKFQAIVSEYGSAFLLVALEDAASWDADFQKWENVERWRSEYGGVTVQRRGKTTSVVLDMDLFTAWVPLADGGALVRGGAHWESLAEATAVLDAAPPKGWKKLRSKLTVRAGGIVVFDAGAQGFDNVAALREESEGGIIHAVLTSGQYALSAAVQAGNDVVRLTLASTG